MVDLLSPEVISANPFLKGMTVFDFRAWTIRKTAGSGAPAGDGFAPAGGGGQFEWPAGRSFSEFGEVTTPAGMSVDVRYRVVDLAELQRASGDLPPRDRSRAASDEQIAGIARNLDPARLLPSPESASGAPIVGPDMMIESGNGRIAALNRAAEEHPERYQAYVRAIEDAGFQVPEGVSRPALVAERVTDLDADARRRFVRESNTSSIGRMSATEQAGVDADYLTQTAFDGYRPGRGLNSPDNAEFVRRVFAAMPQAERAGLMTADGRLNIDGLRRLRQALFARAFDAQDLLKLLAETEHPAVENMLRMLEDLAPDWAAFRAAVDAGYIRPEFDITDQLMDAVRMIVRARIEPRDGQSVVGALRDKLLQGDMFTTRDPEMVDAVMGVFFRGDLQSPVKGNRSRSPDASAEILTRYMAEAEIAGRADIKDLFAAEAGVTPTVVLREAVQAQDARAPMPSRGDSAVESLEGAAGGQPDIRALDRLDTEDGAQSPALARATDAELRELKDAPEAGPFGLVFRDIRDDPEAAISRLMQAGDGEVPDAVIHPLFDRPIAFVHGKPDIVKASGKTRSGFGLKHIEVDHGPDVLADLPRLIREGSVYDDPKGLHRRYIIDDSDPARVAVVRLNWDDAEKTWIVTSFSDDVGEFADRSQWEAFRVTGLGEERAPSPTGQAKDNAGTPENQSDEIARAIADARAALEADPGLTLRMGEGQDAREVSLADLLDDLDQDDALMRSMTSCSLKGTPK
ncbi:hypothetical protein [Paracoccus binzhouensis]|uniref:hypothetical protein n=1 Tax=Paracoccus binzhouensis TaxID=2796149 RepID=UPI0018EEE83B|nr:hypothetical protein [Paracoccus binzhouensis]